MSVPETNVQYRHKKRAGVVRTSADRSFKKSRRPDNTCESSYARSFEGFVRSFVRSFAERAAQPCSFVRRRSYASHARSCRYMLFVHSPTSVYVTTCRSLQHRSNRHRVALVRTISSPLVMFSWSVFRAEIAPFAGAFDPGFVRSCIRSFVRSFVRPSRPWTYRSFVQSGTLVRRSLGTPL